MKIVILTFVLTMLTFRLPASSFNLSLTPRSDGNWQVVVSDITNLPLYSEECVLESSTDLVHWTAIDMAYGPFTIDGVTFIVQPSKPKTFYRAYILYIYYLWP